MSKPQVPRLIQAELDASKAPYEFIMGSRHWKIIVNGIFCGILPLSGNVERINVKAVMNIRAQIRRAIRGRKP